MTERPSRIGRSRAAAQHVIELLEVETPAFHGWSEQTVNWQAGFNLLRWLAGEVPVGGRTLETGCGYSTVLFAALADEHIVVSPNPEEHKRVAAWCDEHGIEHGNVQFVAEPSDRYLPRASEEGTLAPLDAVLIDGDHAYPVPAVDWFYLAPALRTGGLVAVDDISIRACGEVAAFLRADRDRWSYRTTVDDAAVFAKLVDDAEVREVWRLQPWNRRVPSLDERLRTAAHALQLRSRLRARLRRQR